MKPKAYPYIRFSTKEQMEGDSERRQIELIEDAKEWVEGLGFELDESLDLIDRGLSGYKADHIKHGALGRFFDMVRSREIKKGSILIAESFDRLSRDVPEEAFSQFLDLKRKGIKIGILTDRKVYDEKSGSFDLLLPLIEAIRSHEESSHKSKRLKAAWEEKRLRIKDEKLTSRSHKWLKPSKDGKRFEALPDAAYAIGQIFEMKLEGIGAERMEGLLNEDPDFWKPPQATKKNPNRKPAWRKSYIIKILRDPATIGHYQPHRLSDKEGQYREPVGDVIKDYYPPIISEDLFHRVQRMIQENRELNGFHGGKTGKASNLFIHLTECMICGSKMHFINKGKGSKGRTYLLCDHSRRKLGCKAKAIRYDEFENIILDNLEELDLSALMPEQSEIDQELTKLRTRIEADQQRLTDAEKKINNLIDAIASTDSKPVRDGLNQKLEQTYADRDTIKKRVEESERRLGELDNQRKTQRHQIKLVKEVRKLLDQTKDEDSKINLRIRLRVELQKLIARIDVFPLLGKQKPKYHKPEKEREVILFDSNSIRFIRVWFKTGSEIPPRVLMVRGQEAKSWAGPSMANPRSKPL